MPFLPHSWHTHEHCFHYRHLKRWLRQILQFRTQAHSAIHFTLNIFVCWLDHGRSSPPLDPPKHGQLVFPPSCWPHFQTQPCTTFKYVIKSQAVWENARWGRGACAFGHSGTILHPFGRQMLHPQTCSNPPAFQDFSCSCIMIWCCEVGLGGGGREGVFRGWPCRDRIRVQTQEMR